MNKHVLKYLAFCVIALLLNSCNDGENELLEPKVYFENKEYKLEVQDETDTMEQDLQARISAMCSSLVEVFYEIADERAIEAYNEKNGTAYEAFNVSDASFSNAASIIPAGEVYADKTSLRLTNLKGVKEGKPYLLPVRIKSASLPVIEGTDIVYFIITKPVRIMKVANFASHSVKVPIAPGAPFGSITYEALIHIDRLRDNNTIMGTEGILILRIGDQALPGRHNDWIQIAGKQQYHSTQSFETKKWYHVAFTYEQSSGKTVIYINGNKAAEAKWDNQNFDLSADGGGCFVGKVAGFMWGERPFYGYMSEVRIWRVARTENQIKQNMLDIDPKSEGLAVYYKLNGDDQIQKDGKWYIKDASENGMDGLVNFGNYGLNFATLPEPVAIK